MNLIIALTTLALVIPAELPDKTFISCIVLASRYRPLPVWVGTSSGLVIQAGIAVVAGRLLDLLPHKAVQGVVAGLFLAGAAYLFFVPEKSEEEKGERLAAAKAPEAEGRAGDPAPVAGDEESDSQAAEAAVAGAGRA